MHPPQSVTPPSRRRTLTLPLLTLYGLGVTVGAGIYVLIGAAVAQAGPYAWVSFLVAAIVVGFTAFSYAELATRYPVSAGEAAYVDAGFRAPRLAVVVGLLVAISGMVSASAITVGAAGYLFALTGLDTSLLIVGITMSMGVLAWWGITQSVMVAAVVTVIEIAGLVFVIIWAGGIADHNGVSPAELLPPAHIGDWTQIVAASLLAFFAFIEFEDMVNVAEEVKDPRRTIPRAILYIAISIAVLLAVPIGALSTSNAPLTLVFSDAPDIIQTGFALVAIVATVNGVLIQIIMASRVIYGMADRGRLPAIFARLSTKSRTPSVATAFVALCIMSLSLFLPIEKLAGWTSQIVLGVFVCVNASLIAIKRRAEDRTEHFHVHILVPIFGMITSIALLATMLL